MVSRASGCGGSAIVNNADFTLEEPALITRTVGVATVPDHSAVGITTVDDAGTISSMAEAIESSSAHLLCERRVRCGELPALANLSAPGRRPAAVGATRMWPQF